MNADYINNPGNSYTTTAKPKAKRGCLQGMVRWIATQINARRKRAAFDATGFRFGMRADYDGVNYKVYAVNFPERLVGLKNDHDADEDEPFWCRCENVELYPPNESS